MAAIEGRRFSFLSRKYDVPLMKFLCLFVFILGTNAALSPLFTKNWSQGSKSGSKFDWKNRPDSDP